VRRHGAQVVGARTLPPDRQNIGPVVKRQPPQECAIDNPEHRRRQSDAERARARPLEQHPQPELEVMPKSVHEASASRLYAAERVRFTSMVRQPARCGRYHDAEDLTMGPTLDRGRAAVCAYAIALGIAGLAMPLSGQSSPPAAKPAIGAWGVDLTAIDRSVDPGDDFFRFTSGAWMKRTQIPPD